MFRRRKRAEAEAVSNQQFAGELPSPGWQAIDDAVAVLYGEAVPKHVGYFPPAALSTNLQGCSSFQAADHWHYISYGLSELYVPSPEDDPKHSGWGFELTLRVPYGDDNEPPQWPFTIINEMAKYVNSNAVALDAGSRIDLGRPITGAPDLGDAPDTGLTVFALCVDPDLGRVETPNGRVAFLQLVGVTAGEKQEMVASSTAAVLDRLAVGNPRLVTDPGRA